MATIDPRLVELLKKYGEDNTAVWDCHGNWVAYHAAVERMAAKAHITFHKPEIIVNDPDKKTVVICVSATLGESISEWSFGEVSPANNKNSYPYAMAEKRAKDRVALKLLGMGGLVYSEEEADDFKEAKPTKTEVKSASKNDETRKVYTYLHEDLRKITSVEDCRRWWNDADVTEQRRKMPEDWQITLRKEWEDAGKSLAKTSTRKAGDVVADIVEKSGGRIVNDTFVQDFVDGK